MSIRQCILSAQSQGHITPDEAQGLLKLHDSFLAVFRQTMGDGEAAAQAKAALAERLDKEGLQRQRAALLQLDAAERIRDRLLNNVNARGEADPAQAYTYLLEYFGELTEGGGTSVEGRRRALIGLAHADLEAGLHDHRRRFFGARWSQAKPENLVAELFGEDTGDAAAKAFADSFGRVAEDLRQRYNQYGGMIGKLEKWGLPQRHDGRAIRAAGYAAWRDFLIDRLDFDRMRDHLTGRAMTNEQIETALEHVFDSITTEGWAHRDPSLAATGKGALFKQHAESRFLVFKGADAWLEYQREFGEGDVFAAMMGHINVMARDIAAMQVLGPNPEAMLNYARQTVLKEAQLARAGKGGVAAERTEWLGRRIKDPVEYAQAAIHRGDQMWDYIRGGMNAPVSSTAAHLMATGRNLVSASALGSATLSVLSDAAFHSSARQFAGLPVTKMLGQIVDGMRTMPKREAVRAGLILDSAVHVMGEHSRLSGLQTGATWSQYIADRALAASGLSAITQAEKHAFGLTFQGVMADHADKIYGRLPDKVRRTLTRYGIDEELWEVIRLAKPHELEAGSGAMILRAGDVKALDPALVEAHIGQYLAAASKKTVRRSFPALGDDAGETMTQTMIRVASERYLEMILAETEYAVPSGTVRARTVILGDNQPGTVPGELMRSASQFKSFGASVFQLQVGRVMREMAAGERWSAFGRGSALLIGATLLGGLSMQLKGLAKGQDPRPVNDPAFWGAALLQGGGLGIFGDFFFSDINRMGGSFQGTLAGPLVGRLDNVWKLTAGNVVQYAQADKKTNFGRELTQFVRTSVPGSSLWYARLAWERLLMDRLQRQVDPEAYEAFRRRRSQVIKDQRADYWWSPGEGQPGRGVDWANAWKGR